MSLDFIRKNWKDIRIKNCCYEIVNVDGKDTKVIEVLGYSLKEKFYVVKIDLKNKDEVRKVIELDRDFGIIHTQKPCYEDNDK